MLVRKYADGVVAFDPTDGRTYSFPVETFDIVELLASLIREGAVDREALLREAARELGFLDIITDDQTRANLSQWVDLALRLSDK